jgi:hypothetical protein
VPSVFEQSLLRNITIQALGVTADDVAYFEMIASNTTSVLLSDSQSRRLELLNQIESLPPNNINDVTGRLLLAEYIWTVHLILSFEQSSLTDTSTVSADSEFDTSGYINEGTDLLTLLMSGTNGSASALMLQEALEEQINKTHVAGFDTILTVTSVQEPVTITITTESGTDNTSITINDQADTIAVPDWVPSSFLAIEDEASSSTTTTTPATSVEEPLSLLSGQFRICINALMPVLCFGIWLFHST